ncbi:hypothetical protein MRS76_20680 [Rhizobiaceae bacterium n13]|uniref:Uncharacterized protein n=1 Tax=Ferirhizobium litorale TaxID=2927786 RepID=A0AAE3U329_9HYPH|nr:hypothetical protein [Fererhizobium litorale]MDI7864357.1 hypothetical protein [Fererhizobium litorale]MDI7924729.1 hypothetical protein [Fererhizobium litorale]
MRKLLLTMLLLVPAAVAVAQEAAPTLQSEEGPPASATMSQLLARGYEIRASAPNGSRFIVFLQKDQSAYACDFANVANSRCGSLN